MRGREVEVELLQEQAEAREESSHRGVDRDWLGVNLQSGRGFVFNVEVLGSNPHNQYREKNVYLHCSGFKKLNSGVIAIAKEHSFLPVLQFFCTYSKAFS